MEIDDLFKKELKNAKLNATKSAWKSLNKEIKSNPSLTSSHQTLWQGMSIWAKTVVIAVGSGAIITGGIIAFNNINGNKNKSNKEISSNTFKSKFNSTLLADNNQMIDSSYIYTKDSPFPSNNVNDASKISPIKQNPTNSSLLNNNPYVSNSNNSLQNDNDSINHSPIIVHQTNNPISLPQNPVKTTNSTTSNDDNQQYNQRITSNQQNNLTDQHSPINNRIDIKIPNTFTPNGDGINDCFEIKGIEKYPDNILIIYDNRGRKIYSKSHYQNDFCGEGTTTGAYFYTISIKNDNISQKFNGSLHILK